MLNTKRTLCVLGTTFVAFALLGQGCAPASRISQPASSEKPAMEQPTKPEEKKDVMEKKVVAEKTSASSYEPFTKAKYDAARAAGQPVFLFFYANWCPTCREQDPRLTKIVPTHMGGIVGFRVNFNDTATDADEKAIAKEFGVTYQHTGFFIGRDGETKKKTIGSISDEKTLEYLNLISN